MKFIISKLFKAIKNDSFLLHFYYFFYQRMAYSPFLFHYALKCKNERAISLIFEGLKYKSNDFIFFGLKKIILFNKLDLFKILVNKINHNEDFSYEYKSLSNQIIRLRKTDFLSYLLTVNHFKESYNIYSGYSYFLNKDKELLKYLVNEDGLETAIPDISFINLLIDTELEDEAFKLIRRGFTYPEDDDFVTKPNLPEDYNIQSLFSKKIKEYINNNNYNNLSKFLDDDIFNPFENFFEMFRLNITTDTNKNIVKLFFSHSKIKKLKICENSIDILINFKFYELAEFYLNKGEIERNSPYALESGYLHLSDVDKGNYISIFKYLYKHSDLHLEKFIFFTSILKKNKNYEFLSFLMEHETFPSLFLEFHEEGYKEIKTWLFQYNLNNF